MTERLDNPSHSHPFSPSSRSLRVSQRAREVYAPEKFQRPRASIGATSHDSADHKFANSSSALAVVHLLKSVTPARIRKTSSGRAVLGCFDKRIEPAVTLNPPSVLLKRFNGGACAGGDGDRCAERGVSFRSRPVNALKLYERAQRIYSHHGRSQGELTAAHAFRQTRDYPTAHSQAALGATVKRWDDFFQMKNLI